MAFSWQCPYCKHHASIGEENLSRGEQSFNHGNKDGNLVLRTHVITCPNPDCKEYEIFGTLNERMVVNGRWETAKNYLMKWQLKPNSSAKSFPDYIPQVILDDYNEACLIRDLSPKASATLARRCLQGAIRDFWQVTGKKSLFDEIQAIKDQVDPITWQAIQAVREIGNIGAHMEKDINLIIEVEPQEVQLLIGLIEMLFKDWYITRHERQQQLAALIGLNQQKNEAKNST